MQPDDMFKIATLRQLVASGEAKRLREESGLTGPEGAGAVGVSVTAFWRWENRQRMPRGEAALRYAAFLARLQRLNARAKASRSDAA